MKKHLISLLSALLALSLVFVSCSNGGNDNGGNNNGNQTGTGGNVYVAGLELSQNSENATLWINGAPHSYGIGRGYSVFVSGNDLYMLVEPVAKPQRNFEFSDQQ